MKKFKIKPLYCILTLIATIIALGAVCLLSGCENVVFTVNGKPINDSKTTISSNSDYKYEFESYDVEYDISSNCSIAVTEVIKVNYLGKKSTGLLRDLPVNSGTQVKNIKVTGVELIDGGTNVPYSVYVEENSFITVDIGSTARKTNKSETYCITYDYCISNSFVNGNVLPLNPVGMGNDCQIKNATVKLILPDGYQSAVRYVGKYGNTDSDTNFEVSTQNGRTVLTTSAQLNKFEGITFDITFASGSIHSYFDFTPYLFIIAAVILILIVILLKLFVFNKPTLTPIVNFEAPEGMDPLMMGKLIDNRVNPEDVTSLIFYWADKGYIKINLDNKDNPTLIRIMPLPDTATSYEQLVFNGLFKKGDAVKTSDLKYVFYTTYEKAKADINSKTKGLHNSLSTGISILFAILGGLVIGLAPLILGMATVHSSLTYLYGFLALVPALVLYAFSEAIKYNSLKNKPSKTRLFTGLLALGVLAGSGLLIIIIPSSLLPIVPKCILCVLSLAIPAISVMLVCRTESYNEKLNHIVGFRSFIVHAEKDRLEALLESDPQYYYHVLPYAQVLNVSDIWSDKFKALTIAPPKWATASSFDLFDFIVLNHVISHSMRSLSTGMVARPSSSGRSGGGHGHFGGHGGGGFGGGGSRGR